MHHFWKHQGVRWAAVVAWMGLIFFLSAQSTLPDLTGGHADVQDIAGHFSVYAVLALLLQWVMAGVGVRHAGLWALAIVVLYGASDEFHQGFVPGRHPDLFDLATDTAGAAFALAIATWLRARRRLARKTRLESGCIDSATQP